MLSGAYKGCQTFSISVVSGARLSNLRWQKELVHKHLNSSQKWRFQFQANRGHLQIWMPAPESRGFLGYQAQEDQKEPWDPPEREALQDQVGA